MRSLLAALLLPLAACGSDAPRLLDAETVSTEADAPGAPDAQRTRDAGQITTSGSKATSGIDPAEATRDDDAPPSAADTWDPSEGTALRADGQEPDIDRFWTDFQRALRHGTVDHVLDHFHDPVTVDGAVLDRAAFRQSDLFAELVRAGSPLREAVERIGRSDLTGESGVYQFSVGYEVTYDGFVDESGLVVEIGTIGGYYGVHRLMSVG